MVSAHGWAGLEAGTVDKYQGRDKECMLLSLVRCNPGGNPGRLLADRRRINVAITRAKTKLVIIGCARTMAGTPVWAELLGLVRQHGWLLPLPADAAATTNSLGTGN